MFTGSDGTWIRLCYRLQYEVSVHTNFFNYVLFLTPLAITAPFELQPSSANFSTALKGQRRSIILQYDSLLLTGMLKSPTPCSQDTLFYLGKQKYRGCRGPGLGPCPFPYRACQGGHQLPTKGARNNTQHGPCQFCIMLKNYTRMLLVQSVFKYHSKQSNLVRPLELFVFAHCILM